MPPRIDFTSQRLFVDASLMAGAELRLNKEQSHYLATVLRMKPGQSVLVFNGQDGEWRAEVTVADRKSVTLVVGEATRPQTHAPDIWLCFAPVKSARLEFIVQKAVEMGASRIIPMITRRTQVSRINMERMRANVIEAAEQCGVLALPEVSDEMKLPQVVKALTPGRIALFCDEMAEVSDPLAALSAVPRGTPVALLIGPEGGFDDAERHDIRALPGAIALALGPRILRADTAAVAGLTVAQLTLGDWR
jgi:16S rRNA (uracil1498-N3)-methyltransferase